MGPRSAGANPGPACYGRGGTTPTVADANLALGYLNPEYFLHTDVRLDAGAAGKALETIAGPLGYSTTALAAGIFTIVNHAMADGIRVVLADQGYDARDFTLLCFGGAGGIHAPALIEELGIRRLVIPLEAATFSALGMLYSDIRYDFVQTLARPLHRTELGEIVGALDRMREEATERLTRATGAANGAAFRAARGHALLGADARAAHRAARSGRRRGRCRGRVRAAHTKARTATSASAS